MKPRGRCFVDTDLLSRTVGTAMQITCPLNGKEFIHGLELIARPNGGVIDVVSR